MRPLTALAASEQPNGRYIYGAAGSFPNATYQNTNYWVDPVFAFTTSALPGGGSVIAAPVCQQFITPTPTFTPSPSCPVTLISQATFNGYPADRTQELRDMRVLSDPGTGIVGLGVFAGPTINAKRATSNLSWEASYAAYQRVAFQQIVNGVPDQQIWYNLSQSPNNNWFPGRYDGVDYTSHCNLNQPPTLTFSYDRPAAANYAIEHSYDTAINHGALQGGGRVSQRLPTPLPPTPPVPYAYYRYSLIGGSGVTGSAAFVSQSLWMGGLPMTFGAADSCTTPGGPTKGWRYCFNYPSPTPPTPPYGDSSNPFDTHEDLYTYWMGPNSVGQVNQVLQIASAGFQLRILGGQQSLRIIGRQTRPTAELGNTYTDLNQNPTGVNNEIIELGAGNVLNPSALSARTIQLLTSDPINAGREVQMGDYMYIDSNPVHGLLVVGWQEALSCPAAIFNNSDPNQGFRRWTITQFANNRFGPAPNMTNPVPWVVDFTSPPNPADDGIPPPYVQQTQNPVPRPFYCTMYRDFPLNPPPTWTRGVDRFSDHDWQFFTMPNQVSTGNTALDTLYVDPNWNWGANQ